MIANYHTHNELCGHAGGTLEEYTLEAIRTGLTEIGMSDHTPLPGERHGSGMDLDKLDYYLDEVKRLREVYRDRISIRLGLEAEYAPEYVPFYEDLLKNRGLEYLILGQHFFDSPSGRYINAYTTMTSTADYVEYAKSAMEGMATGLFTYFCHPDLPFMNELGVDEDARRAMNLILEESVKHDYILELNANGLRRGKKEFKDGYRYPYPTDFFWEEVARTNLRVIIGSDCHSVNALYDHCIPEAEEMCERLHLNLIKKLTF